MAQATTSRPFETGRPTLDVATPTPVRAVKAWAVIGVGWLAVTLWEWVAWARKGKIHPVHAGPDKAPGWMIFTIHFTEALMVAVGVWVVYRFVYRSIKRTGHISTDGLLAMAWFTLWYTQDPFPDYTRTWFTYNSHLVNLGCPQCYMPGWQGGKTMAEPILWSLGAYTGVLFLGTILCCWLMRKLKERYPKFGPFRLVLSSWLILMFADFVLELIWMRGGAYVYPGASGIVLFKGHYYQFPLWEAVWWGAGWASLACCRYFKNDKGETLAERGIDEVRATPKQKQGLRFLAFVGILQTAFFLCYNAPVNWLGTHAGSAPKDILSRSYFTSGICGKGTDMACPGPRVPMPTSKDSPHLTPAGTFKDGGKGIPVQIPGYEGPGSPVPPGYGAGGR